MVLHASPWVVLGGGLGVPYITGVSPQLARFQSVHNSLGLTDLTTGGVDQIAALLEVANHLCVEQVLCALQAKPNGTQYQKCRDAYQAYKAAAVSQPEPNWIQIPEMCRRMSCWAAGVLHADE